VNTKFKLVIPIKFCVNSLSSHFKLLHLEGFDYRDLLNTLNHLHCQNGLRDAFLLDISKKKLIPLPILMKNLHLIEAIIQQKVVMYYQPIIDIKNREVLGWEALCRLKIKDNIISPGQFMGVIKNMSIGSELDWLCRKLAMKTFPYNHKNSHLFINVNPISIYSDKFGLGWTKRYCEKFNLCPERVVIELTEAEEIEDVNTLNQMLSHYKKQGFKIAIDDFGTGYNSIKLLLEVIPIDFIKLPHELVHGITKSSLKWQIVNTLIDLASRKGARVIAEGVENKEDLATLEELGVKYMQGYLFAKPSPKGKIDREIFSQIVTNRPQSKKYDVYSMKDILKNLPSLSVSLNWRFLDIKQKLDNIPEQFVLLETEEGTYLLDLEEYRIFATSEIRKSILTYKKIKDILKTGYSWIIKKLPVCEYTPNIIDILLFMDRNRTNVAIITVQGKMLFYITRENLLEKLYYIFHKARLSLNPLTSLPGNVLIEHEIEERLSAGKPFWVGYVDIDNFKPYNDRYGFAKGDEMIKTVAGVLRNTLSPIHDSFLGHIGGDDFVFILPNNVDVKEFGEELLEKMKMALARLYDEKDLKQGYFISKDREGNKRQFPLASVSVAIVSSKNKKTYQEIAIKAAEVKKQAKAIEGSALVISD